MYNQKLPAEIMYKIINVKEQNIKFYSKFCFIRSPNIKLQYNNIQEK